MPATDTYTKYNLHSAAPWGKMSGYAKNRGKRPGVSGGEMSYTRTNNSKQQLMLTSLRNLLTDSNADLRQYMTHDDSISLIRQIKTFIFT